MEKGVSETEQEKGKRRVRGDNWGSGIVKKA